MLAFYSVTFETPFIANKNTRFVPHYTLMTCLRSVFSSYMSNTLPQLYVLPFGSCSTSAYD